jgi:hypothetical protein
VFKLVLQEHFSNKKEALGYAVLAIALVKLVQGFLKIIV